MSVDKTEGFLFLALMDESSGFIYHNDVSVNGNPRVTLKPLPSPHSFVPQLGNE